MALVVRPDSPIKTDRRPGRRQPKQSLARLNYGHQGTVTIPHLAMEEFLQTAGIDIKDIPFRGEPLVMTDLLGGRIDVARSCSAPRRARTCG